MRNILFSLCPVIPRVLLGEVFFHLPEGNLEVRDYWSSEEAALHISTKEMLALHKVLQSSLVALSNCRVDVNGDSQVLLDTWSREGSRSPQLTAATKKCSIWFPNTIFNWLWTKCLQREILPILPQDTFHPQILRYFFRVWSESKKHLEGRQVISLISWPWIPTCSRISRGPFDSRLNPRELICLHKTLSLGAGRRALRFFPPFNLIGPTLKFLLHSGISFTIVVPNLPDKPFWWPILFSSASDRFVLCRKGEFHSVFYPQKGGGFGRVPSPVELWVSRVNN